MQLILLTLLISVTGFPLDTSRATNSNYQKTLDTYNLIGLPEVVVNGWNGAGQTIVVIDNESQIDHPYLNKVFVDGNCTSRVVCGGEFLNPSIRSGQTHLGDGFYGCMVVGISAGQKSSDAPGRIAHQAIIFYIDNTDGNSQGLIEAMDWILSIQEKYHVIVVGGSIEAPNLSTKRGSQGDCSLDSILTTKFKKLVEAGIAMIFAAGSGGKLSNLNYPTCIPEVILVGALTSMGEIAFNFKVSKSISVLAPADVMSSNGNGGYLMGSDTPATNHVVAGSVALLKHANPNATSMQIKSALKSTRKRVTDIPWQNIPVLDLPSAINSILNETDQSVEMTAVLSAASPMTSSSYMDPWESIVTTNPNPTVTITASPSAKPTMYLTLKEIFS